MITDWFDGPERGRFLGFQQAFASLGGVVSLPLAGTGFPKRAGWMYLLALVATLVFHMAPTQLPFLLRDLDASPAVAGIFPAGSCRRSSSHPWSSRASPPPSPGPASSPPQQGRHSP
ncbi:MAG TPA: hypothetical protein VF330_40500 [Lentzea sp.]